MQNSPSSWTLGAAHQRAQMAELRVAEGVEVSPPPGVVLSQCGVGSAVPVLDQGCNSCLEYRHRLWKVRWAVKRNMRRRRSGVLKTQICN